MKLAERMKRLVDETQDISVLAFGDLSSALILSSATRAACPREVLDQLGERAAESFALLDRQRHGRTNGTFGTAVLHFDSRGTRIFTRADPQSEDVLCADCDAGAPLERRLAALRTLAESAGPS